MSWMSLGHQGMWHERTSELGGSEKKEAQKRKKNVGRCEAQGLGLRC
jgi:hypothetical protein